MPGRIYWWQNFIHKLHQWCSWAYVHSTGKINV